MLQFCLSASNQRLTYHSAKHARILLSEEEGRCPGPNDREKKFRQLIFLILYLFDRGIREN